MTLRYEWGIDLEQCPIACTLNPASVGAFAFSANSGRYAPTNLSALLGSGEYSSLSGGLQTLLNAALTTAGATERVSVIYSWPTGFTVDLTAGTSLAFSFSSSVEAEERLRLILGWTSGRTVTGPTTSQARPWLVINPAQQCRSLPFTEEYEPAGIATEAVADDGEGYMISRDTSELWSDWVQVAEVPTGPAAFADAGTPPRARHATALVPFTYQHAWVHSRKGNHPFAVIENGVTDVHKLRADGASFNATRFGGERNGYWQIQFRTRYLGTI